MKDEFDKIFTENKWDYSQSSHYQSEHGGPRKTYEHIYKSGYKDGRNECIYEILINVVIGAIFTGAVYISGKIVQAIKKPKK
ncbi:MAG: hypothetical protein NC120_06145 [Ruminococcus sp.]|nr:hypothetical protein [Ruminococcus sp.]